MSERKGPFCGGQKHQGEGTCRQPAGAGTDHLGTGRCQFHGGCTPSHRQAAIKDQAAVELARLNIAPVEDPLTELAAVTAQVLAWKDSMAAKVNQLGSLRYEGEGSGEQLRAEVALWERALDRCERFLTAMARLNIDERLTRITEARATTIIAVFVAALDTAGIDAERRDAVIQAADAEFARQAGVIL